MIWIVWEGKFKLWLKFYVKISKIINIIVNGILRVIENILLYF